MFAGNSGIGNVEAATLIVVRVRRWAVLHEIPAVPEDRFPFGVAARHKRIRAGLGAIEVKSTRESLRVVLVVLLSRYCPHRPSSRSVHGATTAASPTNRGTGLAWS